MKRRTYLTTIGAAGTLTLAGCLEDDDEGQTVTSDENGDDGDDGDDSSDDSTGEGLVIEEHDLVVEQFSTHIEGILLNDTGEEQSYVEVQSIVYDENDVRIDDFFTNTTDLSDGERWRFEIFVTADADDIERYELKSSTSAL